MNKREFLDKLEEALYKLPESERNKSLLYYSEMIEDHMEDGKTEEEAIAQMEAIDVIAQRILDDTPIHKFVSEKIKETIKETTKGSNNKTLIMVLTILSFPIWFPILITVPIVLFSLVVALGGVIFSIYAVAIAFGVSAVACFASIPIVWMSTGYAAITFFGLALMCVGISILTFRFALFITKGMSSLILILVRWLKGLFVKKEGIR